MTSFILGFVICVIALVQVTFAQQVGEKQVFPWSVHASYVQAGNEPHKAIDRSLSTYWTGKGDGQQICFELVYQEYTSVGISFYNGSKRSFTFDLLASDGATFATVLSGVVSNKTNDMQLFSFPPELAAEMCIVGHGNDSSTMSARVYNSYTEVNFFSTLPTP